MRPRISSLRMFATVVMVAAVCLVAHAQGGRGAGGGSRRRSSPARHQPERSHAGRLVETGPTPA